jgi:hypothetical protein
LRPVSKSLLNSNLEPVEYIRMADQPAPISLSSVRERAARRRLAEAKQHNPERKGGRAWINGREVAPNPGLAHLSVSYD